ncbi:hypothetical protein [Goodfellowiella coeruleoviolacea]|uniref:Uncharacterized protein n=1 Tax=Goodfellowiella coeruleoviolacea TaxID=334858 RepID=A0AAE3GF07_9PSEU|nr:hypothetical protein [Goodfellowiella coeruleoviolacea]MCP2164938.1 hypothetical protein [Goodfellowiella coeruleoviolacea]
MAAEPITVHYATDGDSWQVIVSTGARELITEASSLVSAREQAEDLIAEIRQDTPLARAVHLLDGDPVAFTAAYLRARHGLPAPARPALDEDADLSPDTGAGHRLIGRRQRYDWRTPPDREGW